MLTGRDMVLVCCDSTVVSSDKYEKGDQVMNKWNRLLATLDHTFGFKDQKKSTIRKLSQTFDERTNEHVIMLEYRVRRGGDGVVTRNPRKKDAVGKLKLLSKLAARARER
jgi:hypothetical protein